MNMGNWDKESKLDYVILKEVRKPKAAIAAVRENVIIPLQTPEQPPTQPTKPPP